jgi:hypothetical protein
MHYKLVTGVRHQQKRPAALRFSHHRSIIRSLG